MTRSRLQQGSLWLAILAVVPYVILKLLWLGGSTVGLRKGAGAAEMGSDRMVAGNIITVLLVVLAGVLAFGLTRPWGRQAPAWLVLVLAVGAAGLLAPILLGLPLGVALQLVVQHDVTSGGEGDLAGWVFAVVYGGFGLLAVALAILLRRYVLDRWGRLFAAPPRPPVRWAAVAGALGMLPFGAAMLYWGLAGPGTTGPQGMESLAQRTVLAVTGILAVVGFIAPFASRVSPSWPQLGWLATWVGCASTAIQGPTQLLLAQEGRVQPAIALIALLASPGGCAYGLAVLNARRHDVGARSA
ncbi:hypothetical protein GA0074695_2337 [Micromonospora viridifaciens]|uniref:Uncharacterized protein n=1 Tax=Micromonospora viridifaciens TaxID=1881 RepID=A0A1C4WDX4_MICVI|nr:hypothetical protein [Micromonospora viridifaciens]SCE94398.1 hypothetical protein GA0074695_2337 [Micromonospora viridifaciens]